VEKLGNSLVEEVLKDIEAAYEKPVPPAVKVALADHFWCDLLAQLAHVIDDGMKFFGSVPERVTDLILKSRAESGRLRLERFVVKVAVNSVWKCVKGLTLFGRVRKLLLVIRILSVLLCKAPERHRAVVEYCLDPLKNKLTLEAKQRLVRVLREWLPEIENELENAMPAPM
jgi:hypothetical protein